MTTLLVRSCKQVWFVTGIVVLAISLGSCGGGDANFQQRQLVALTVHPAEAGGVQGAQVPFSATATFDQAPTTKTDFAAHWASSDPTIATVNDHGVAICLELGGPITITASASGKGGTVKSTATLTCASPATSVTLEPNRLLFACRNVISAGCQCDTERSTLLTNTGTSTLTINGITVEGSAYHLTANTCAQKLDAGQSCEISVGWSRHRSFGDILVNDDAVGSPQKVDLAGFLSCQP
ncbi:MAG TPA: hypothetical protein VHR84_06760 [Terriglobales bacterium]|jgi:hypothetical protein|nr:hypothetical protein [Terriglobales bacterium]